jgi:D-xylose transport system permease protein
MTDTIDDPAAPGDDDAGRSADVSTPSSAITGDALVVMAPDVLADSLGDYLRAWWKRIRNGESGALPIIVGLIVICIFFQVQSHVFLSSGNIVNLLVQSTFFILLGMGELYALLMGDIDLSVGFVGAVGATITIGLISPPYNWPWWAGAIVGMLAAGAIGLLQGTLITRLKIPSFVVTLAGLLGWEGVLIFLFDFDKGSTGGVLRVSNDVVYNLVNGNMTVWAGWVLMIALVVAFALLTLVRAANRRSHGLSAPPLSVTIFTIVGVAIAGAVLVYICNLNRGALTPLQGVPFVIPFVIVILFLQTALLGRTKLGRYIYAIGASPEAARRAGINVNLVRTVAFGLCSFVSGLAALVYASRLGSISIGFDGGTYVLFAVAAAVIGGASLAGGYGKAIHPVLGGLVIAALTNGLDLLNISTAGTDVATAVVLIVAVAVDATLRRRGRTATF